MILRAHLQAHNWALNIKKEAFDKKEKIPNAIELHRELNKLKKTDVPWMYESSKTSPQNALRDCDRAFQNFFTRCKKKSKVRRDFLNSNLRKMRNNHLDWTELFRLNLIILNYRELEN